MLLLNLEKFVKNLEVDVYPITFMKYVLNQEKIMSYIHKLQMENFKPKKIMDLDSQYNCQICKSKKKNGYLCRNHNSIKRIINADNVAYDTENEIYFYKNEIFKLINNKLVIFYCPHPNLIRDEITTERCIKINSFVVIDSKLPKEFKFKNVKQFTHWEITRNVNCKCWFNKYFSIISIPGKMEEESQFVLSTNK